MQLLAETCTPIESRLNYSLKQPLTLLVCVRVTLLLTRTLNCIKHISCSVRHTMQCNASAGASASVAHARLQQSHQKRKLPMHTNHTELLETVGWVCITANTCAMQCLPGPCKPASVTGAPMFQLHGLNTRL